MVFTEIRKAKPEEYETIRLFYHALIDDMQNAVYHPGWKKDIYPDPEDLKLEIAEGCLFCCCVGDEPVASMAVNHRFQDDAYGEARWGLPFETLFRCIIRMLGGWSLNCMSMFCKKGPCVSFCNFSGQ